MSVLELTRAHRADLQQLTGLAAADLTSIWDELNRAAGFDGLMDEIPALVGMYGAAAATLGADFYDELRDAEAISGRFTALAAELPDAGRSHALAGWGIAEAAKDSVTALTLVSGGLQRIIANADRQSVVESTVADPKAEGWQRVSHSGCGFCSMLSGRGEVYSKASADFASHDHCHCVAVPVFGGRPRPVKPFTPSERVASDADRARVRDYLAANPQAG